MHYGVKAFTKNGEDTITVLNPENKYLIGSNEGFSNIDVMELRQMYNCSKSTIFLCFQNIFLLT